MFKFLTKLFRSDGAYRKIVAEINALEPEISKLTDHEIKAESLRLRATVMPAEAGIQAGSQIESWMTEDNSGVTLDEILPRAFALVRETAKRALGQRHFDVQLIGGAVLHQGKIAEMRTGEGKTLAATT